MDALKAKLLRSPWLESLIMIGAVVISYAALAILSVASAAPIEGGMSTGTIVLYLAAFFLLSVAIAAISVIAGIGGGVIFTPIMLAFTSVNSLVVRGTGIIVAMFSGLISTGIFLKKGLGNYRLCLISTLCQGTGALAGAMFAIVAANKFGDTGEGILRLTLGVLLFLIAIYLFLGGKKLEYPVIKKVGPVTKWLELGGQYFEESEGVTRKYEVTRAPLGLVLLFVVGIIGGFFGMGGGWAITPVLNMAMGLPLKIAAANSGIILGIGNCLSVWPYIFAGSVIALFALPWLAGQVIGGFVGSYALVRMKVGFVRLILIGIMVYTSFGLVTKALEMLGIMSQLPSIVQVLLFTFIIACVLIAGFMQNRTKKSKEAKK